MNDSVSYNYLSVALFGQYFSVIVFVDCDTSAGDRERELLLVFSIECGLIDTKVDASSPANFVYSARATLRQ